MSSFGVSLYLTTLLVVFYLLIKRVVGKKATIRVLLGLLLLMFIPGLFMDVQIWGAVKRNNMSLFFILLILTAIPWICFDKWYKNKTTIMVTDKGVVLFSFLFKVVIILCTLSYIYVFPYALQSYSMGAGEIRTQLGEISVIPSSPLTTLGVAVSTLSPFYVFFFYISLLHLKLRKYSFLLFFSSFIYIAFSMPFMARDGYVVLPIMYLINFFMFRNTLGSKERKKVKKYMIVLGSISGSLLLVYSVSRFFTSGETKSLISGTWGYLYQQPYVFDRTLNYQHSWHGVDLRFPILTVFSGNPPIEVERYQDFETKFGTMLSEFYSIGGYWSLFVFTGAFILIYYLGLRTQIKKGNTFGIFIFFLTYLIL